MLAHRILGGCNSSISVACPSPGSALLAAARACLWNSFRRCSTFCGQTGKESSLLAHPETMVSCLLGSSRVFPGLPPGQLWHTNPLQAVFTQPTPVLSLGSDLRSPSLSSQPPPAPAGEQTSLSSQECWSAPILCAGISPLCPRHPCCRALLCVSEASPTPLPVSTSEGAS